MYFLQINKPQITQQDHSIQNSLHVLVIFNQGL